MAAEGLSVAKEPFITVPTKEAEEMDASVGKVHCRASHDLSIPQSSVYFFSLSTSFGIVMKYRTK